MSWGLCRLGRVRPLADLGLVTCMFNEFGCQMKRSEAVLTAVLHSGGGIFTGASVAIAERPRSGSAHLAAALHPPAQLSPGSVPLEFNWQTPLEQRQL